MAAVGLVATSLCAIITATAAFAAGENIVASKKYTDDTFQTKIPAEVSTLSDITGSAGALIGATDANGVVTQRLIIPGYKNPSNNGELGFAMYYQSNENNVPYGSWGNVADEFTAILDDIYRMFNDGNDMGYDPRYSVPSMELALDWVGDIGGKLSDIDDQLEDIDGQLEGIDDQLEDIDGQLGDIGESLETKQPMIPALADAMGATPGFVLVPSGGDDGQLGLRFIIPGLDEMPELGSRVHNLDVRNWWLFGGERPEEEVTAIVDDISRIYTNDNWINGGGVGMTLKDILYSPASLKLVSDVWNESQRTITGHAANAADSILTDSATNGVVQKRAIFDGSATYAAGTHATHIPTMGAMMTAIQNGSAALIPAGTAGNVVTYTGTAGVVGSNTVASAATYNQQTGALTNGSSIANVTLVETKQKKKVCAGWPDYVAVADRTDANCWLWSLPD